MEIIEPTIEPRVRRTGGGRRPLMLMVAMALGCGGGVERSAAEPRRELPPAAAAVDAGGIPTSRGGQERVGQPAPAWGAMTWLGSDPLQLSDLRGQVVLIRFWTDTCPFCRATAPALATIDEDYRDRGVTVIGMYHPKPRGTERAAPQVAEVIDEWGWRFPVALDLDWAVLDAFWLHDRKQAYTSVSFVLDAQGVIRYVHPGPEFHDGGPPEHEQCRQDYRDVRAALDALLAESVATL